MAGLYIHIPFCRQACIYCDFHFTLSQHYQDDLCDALISELQYRRESLSGEQIQSIYFGGGTPSLLTELQLSKLFNAITRNYSLANNPEITLEANPDDLNAEKLQILKISGVNRLSIGVQSFYPRDLAFLNRSHSAETALRCIEMASEAGFNDITIDLIYGIPGLSDQAWEENLRLAARLNINHLSCYSLTLEKNTPYFQMVKKKRLTAPDESQAASQMELLMKLAPELGFEQYEISNFARNKSYAKHNTAYWMGASYIGIGPSAHSFDQVSRRNNLNNNQQYIRALLNGDAPHQIEILDHRTRYNELVLTGLRTMWGLSTEKLNYLENGYTAYFERRISPWIKQGMANQHEDGWSLTSKGFMLADHIVMDCMAG